MDASSMQEFYEDLLAGARTLGVTVVTGDQFTVAKNVIHLHSGDLQSRVRELLVDLSGYTLARVGTPEHLMEDKVVLAVARGLAAQRGVYGLV